MGARATTPLTHAAQLATARWGVSVALTGGRSAEVLAELLRELTTRPRADAPVQGGG